MFTVLLVLCLSVCLTVAKNELYERYSLYEITATNLEQAKLVNQLENELPVDMWSETMPGRPGQVLVSPTVKDSFEKALEGIGADFKIAVENIKEQIDFEDGLLAEATRKSNASRSRANGLPFDTVYRYDVVDAYLVELAEKYPNTVQVASAGRSFEGRDVKYLKISSTNFQDHSKPVVMMESLLHCREWIGLPATLYAIHKLVLDVTEPELLRDIDWIIVPIANPDGYEFSHTSTRFWRKNRNTSYGLGIIASCMGVDLNRNFDIHFGQASSDNFCTDTFHGSGPFSEPETANIRDLILEHRHRLELFLDIHSYGSWILYGYGNGVLPPNGLSIHVAGIRMAEAIDHVKWPSNPNYVVGNVAAMLYEASGSAQDYAQYVGATLSYTYELPAYRNQGAFNGFLVDPDFIEQAGFETWEGIKAGARYALENFRMKRMTNS